MDRDPRRFEIFKDDLQRSAIAKIADMPERAISDAEPMANGDVYGSRVVSSEGAIHTHHLDPAANLKPPRLGFAFTGAAQNALMTGELIRVIRTAVAGEVAGRAIDDGAQLGQPARFQ